MDNKIIFAPIAVFVGLVFWGIGYKTEKTIIFPVICLPLFFLSFVVVIWYLIQKYIPS